MMFLAILVLIAALMLSSTAAVFSIVGLTTIFSASVVSIAIMAIALEFGKIITTVWAHRNWHNKEFKTAMRLYMVSAIVVLMLITDIGIFGYLSDSHIAAMAPSQDIQLKLDRVDQEIASEQTIIDSENKQLKELDDSINVYLKNDRATQGLAARKQQEAERKTIANTINSAQQKINELQAEEVPLKQQMSDTTRKIGPIKYVAQLFWGDNYQAHLDSAVRTMILIIMSVFDPLALILVIACGISLKDYWDEMNANKGTEPKIDTNKVPVKTEPKTEPKIEVK